MCGIGFLLASSPAEQLTLDRCLDVLRRRGPDADKTTLVELQNGGALHLMAAVLHLRGDRMYLQPSEDAGGNVLLWNGEVFGGLEVGPLESDTGEVLRMLSGTSSHQEVVSALAGVSGPFSFVYWVPDRRALYYGRDAVGRRSLVIRRPRAPGEPLTVLSCLPGGAGLAGSDSSGETSYVVGSEAGHRGAGPEGDHVDGVDAKRAGGEPAWEEVQADGIYSLDLDNLGGGAEGEDWNVPSPIQHPWPVSRGTGATTTPRPSVVEPSGVSHYRQRPSASIDNESKGIVSSGQAGSDLELRAVGVVSSNGLPSGTAFVAGLCGVEAAGLASTLERARIPASSCPGSVVGNEASDEDPDDKVEKRSKTALEGASVGGRRGHGPERALCKASSGLLSHLRRSIRRRVRSIPYASTPGSKAPDRRIGGGLEGAQFMPGISHSVGGSAAVPARVGVLFSGGLDSVVLAAMLAEGGGDGDGGPAVPEGEAIDLVNVCFDSPSGHASPDRLASMAAVRELQALFPSHAWRLLCVDASYEDVLRHRKAIWRVMQPCSTTMDFNIAAAFWFASSGRGWLYRPPLQSAAPPSPPPGPLESLRQPPRVGASNDANPPPDPMEEIGCSGRKIERATALVATHANTTGKATGAVVGHSDTGETVATSVEAGPAPPMASVDDTATEERGRSGKVDMPSKVNKNNDELCPVGGCRRLLKPGCVFGSCSRCCLKAQGLLDAAAGSASLTASADLEETQSGVFAPRQAATSDGHISCSSSVSGTRATVVGDTAKYIVEADAARVNGSAVPSSGISSSGTSQDESPPAAAGVVAGVASGREKKQLQCKAHAVSQALRALEDHLTNHFDELLSPFCADELALLLRRDALTRQVRVGRDVHFRSPAPGPSPAGGGVEREKHGGNDAHKPIKWCPTHKSRSRGAGGERGEPGETLRGNGSQVGADVSAGHSASATVFTSAVRVLLVGIGADEFMAGYSRHRNAYNRGGAAALTDELLKDQGRLWTRNLGRDDRSIADHGREARFPFLDEDVVGFIRSLPLRDICNMEEPPGVGDKKILREVASHLGLDSCRSLPKRAIQFGSRIAQHCARHTHGSHRRGSGSDPACAIRSVV